jgi:type IV secretory pathway ATPase VirB11/archaellum biosynthesis ATPase
LNDKASCHAPGVSIGEQSLMVAVKNIARRLGHDISESRPILDSRLPDGSRVAAGGDEPELVVRKIADSVWKTKPNLIATRA